MTNSINTNIAAFFAQENITTASQSATSNVARLSSGNAIVEASDNVTALAIGTSIGTQVSVLNTAATNAAQGTSLLQVADGALAQIQTILQQQQSIANQAQSGTLTDTDRGFLNQEFQTLTNEINALASGTTFNGVALINGAIAQGGSTSSNPLQNKGLVASTTAPTIAGFTNDTAAANQSKASQTYVTGAFVDNGTTGFTTGTTITQPANSYDKSLYGNLAATGTFSTFAHNTGAAINWYDISYKSIDGTIYEGTIAATLTSGTLTTGNVTLTATSSPSTHATIKLTVDGTGFTVTHDNSLAIDEALSANFNNITYTSGTFAAAPVITQPSPAIDSALRGDLSQGSFKVQLATGNAAADVVTSTSTAKGYLVTYTLNGTAYSGFIQTTNGSAGDLGLATGTTLLLSGGTGHATLLLTTNTQFGTATTSSVDQSAQLLSALQANFAGATALNGTASATVTGQVAQAGIGLVSATSDPTENDESFVGALSSGTFTVSGSAPAGYSVAYTINNSTYQGILSASEVANGGTLVLDNGTGSLAFAITGGATSTLTSTAFQTALTNQFAGATAHATHLVASTLQSNGNGGTVPGSAITASSTAGTLLDGFSGANVQLTSSQFTGGATNLPPISDFTATGSGTSTVFSVNIGGTTYSTQGTITADANKTLAGSTFDGTAGVLNFYKNGDKTDNPSEVLQLTFNGVIGTSAKIATTSEVSQVTDALNTAFGGGGASGSGGLTFQLGATTAANVTVNIASATTSALFAGANLDVSTASTAATASTAVGTALNSITASRANVGALETQFNFAAAALQSSIQNETAAQSSLLDTNVATESTAFATNQVKLQAGISVLAQANQQTQALLKLIG